MGMVWFYFPYIIETEILTYWVFNKITSEKTNRKQLPRVLQLLLYMHVDLACICAMFIKIPRQLDVHIYKNNKFITLYIDLSDEHLVLCET